LGGERVCEKDSRSLNTGGHRCKRDQRTTNAVGGGNNFHVKGKKTFYRQKVKKGHKLWERKNLAVMGGGQSSMMRGELVRVGSWSGRCTKTKKRHAEGVSGV